MTTVFHGSYTEVATPLVKLGRSKVDFGQGFYVTKLQQQAEAWARVMAERKGKKAKAVVSVFSLDMDGLMSSNFRIKTFEAMWLSSDSPRKVPFPPSRTQYPSVPDKKSIKLDKTFGGVEGNV